MKRFLRFLRWMPWRPMKLPSRPQAHSHFERRFCGLAITVNYAEPRCISQLARIFADFREEASLDVDEKNTSTAGNLDVHQLRHHESTSSRSRADSEGVSGRLRAIAR
jgi:hypothetical protein